MALKIWCMRYYTFIRSAKHISNTKDNALRYMSTNFISENSHDNADDVSKPAVSDKLLRLISAPQPDERGYVEESCLNSNNDVTPINQLQDCQTINYDIMPKIKTSIDDLIFRDEDIKMPRALDKCTEDVSDFGTAVLPSFNIAKFANKSRTIQELMKLGVNLHKYETEVDLIEFLLSADFEKDISPYIIFLYDCGVPANYLGQFLTKNLSIFQQDMEDLRTRIRYLRFHDFDLDMIKTIICKHPMWLNYTTKFIDTRLGHFQNNFKLKGSEIRNLSVKLPKLIVYKMKHINENTFAIKEEMGFDNEETKMLLLKSPNLWVKSRKNIVNAFDYVHNEMKLSHVLILSDPCILLCRKRRLEHRHTFLVKLGRAQYDPTKPLYVSSRSLICGTDDEFCKNVAKTNIDVYNLHLMTM